MNRRKNNKKSRSKWIQIRVSEFEKNRIKWLSQQYADSNLSFWVVYWAMNAPRGKIKKKEISQSLKK